MGFSESESQLLQNGSHGLPKKWQQQYIDGRFHPSLSSFAGSRHFIRGNLHILCLLGERGASAP
jgi:hypothetical protein